MSYGVNFFVDIFTTYGISIINIHNISLFHLWLKRENRAISPNWKVDILKRSVISLRFFCAWKKLRVKIIALATEINGARVRRKEGV